MNKQWAYEGIIVMMCEVGTNSYHQVYINLSSQITVLFLGGKNFVCVKFVELNLIEWGIQIHAGMTGIISFLKEVKQTRNNHLCKKVFQL